MQSYNFRTYRIRLLLLIFAITFLHNERIFSIEQKEKAKTDTSTKIAKSSGPYCGLYCLYTVMKMAGRKVDFVDLVKTEYIGSRKGSSLAELKKSAEDYGLYAIPVGKLTNRELLQSSYPIILHVKSEIGPGQYDHYELFLGTENNQARLFDPPNPIKLVNFRELVPQWDGNGLIISAEPIDIRAFFASTRKRFMLYAAAAIVAILVMHRAKRWLPGELLNTRTRLFGLSVTQAGGFALVALLCGIIYHFANDAGLLANANATASIQQAHAANFIPKVSEKKVHKLLDSDTVFIDARFARDYKAGHLDGAISVPVDANDVECQKATADIPKDARIVMYCQSASCTFAEKVAIKLITDGYSNISIFRGGWAEWVAKNGKKEDASL